MALIDWDDSYSIKIDIIDTHHKKLFDIINNLNDAMKARKSKDAMQGILHDLLDYTVFHFGFEEKNFAKFNYPDTPAHKVQHTKFIDRIKEFQDKFASGQIMLSIEVMGFLRDWLIQHIKGTDTKYVDFFKGKDLVE